jgi:transcriptional regulator with XRE-family HTH domain
MSQAGLAEELGVDESTIHRWETGDHSPSPALLARVEDVLGNLMDKASCRATGQRIMLRSFHTSLQRES